MAILIRPPGRHFKKRKSETAQQVLERLEKYLNENTDEPVEMLCGFWKDQQDAITYQELREAVKEGYLNETVFRDWTQDYSVMMLEKMVPIWTASMEAGALAQPIIEPLNFSFDTQTPGVLNWINTRGGNFVTSCTRDQRQAIAALLQKKVTEQYTIDELSRLIRPCIGLTKDQAKATSRLYDHVKATLEKDHPRMKKESIRRRAMDTAVKYAEKQHRQRAFTIAQTEMAFAYNRGADEGVRQAMKANLLGVCAKKWCTSGDDQVCPTCAALDGTIIEMDQDFGFKGRILFPGHKQLPPAHPRCGCAVEYIEIEPPKLSEQVGLTEEAQTKEKKTVNEEGDVTDFARDTVNGVNDEFYGMFGIHSKIDTVKMEASDFDGLLNGALAYIEPQSPNIIHLNPAIFKDEETFYTSLGGRIKAYHRNASPKSVVCHEISHTLENDIDSVRIVNDISENYIKDHPKDAMDAFLADWQVAGETISRYAGTTEHEFWAEAFGDVFANGKNASEVSQKLVRRAREELGVNKRRKRKMKKFSEMIQKSHEREADLDLKIKNKFKIAKADDEKHQAFGWANVSIRADGELIEDWQGDIVEPDVLEQAVYKFVELYREGGEMHERGGVAVLIESAIFTEEKMKAIGIELGTIPVGWWIGFKVLDDDVWEKVKDGTYSMFSIEGEAERIEVSDGE